MHRWDLSPGDAGEVQRTLAGAVVRDQRGLAPGLVAGVDASVSRERGTVTGAAVVLSYPEMSVVESSVVQGSLDFPYVPGLLSFREAPVLLAALETLEVTPDLVIVDGQGIAHPRRLGLASHLGLLLDTPTIGCAKSRLIGRHDTPDDEPGSCTDLVDGDEVIGAVVRTRRATRPVYVSVGSGLDLPEAVHWVLACCRGYRLPEPPRRAHQAAGGHLKPDRDSGGARAGTAQRSGCKNRGTS